MTTKYKPILWWPQKNIDKIFITQIFFLKTAKNIEIQNFDPPPPKKKKNDPSLRMYENIRVPPWDITQLSEN